MSDVQDKKAALERDALSEAELRKLEQIELGEWLDSLDYVLASGGRDRVSAILGRLEGHAAQHGIETPFTARTPYVNTIPPSEEPEYPGDLDIERRIRHLLRWNGMAMVARANHLSSGIGGHLGSYASSATLLEVGFNHFFRGPGAGLDADHIYFQGHASPGIYARSYLEKRFPVEVMRNFRHELSPEGPGLSSYPHPWLMPDYWSFPTVSMGLGPIMSIYQARFIHYLEDRGLKERGNAKVWAILGDGETDEPESLGAIKFAARERLDNLIWVINCNLQRLDGPVFGNGQIMQELEGIFRGAGWNVIKLPWGSNWDELIAKDTTGALIERFNNLVDGESQRYAAFGGQELMDNFFNTPELKKLIEGWTVEDLDKLNRGGHDPVKVYAAFDRAVKHKGSPTVILARTVKGYGLGDAGQGKNVAHQQKSLPLEELRTFRDRFEIPVSDDDLELYPFQSLDDDSEEYRYLKARRDELGGWVPQRVVKARGMPAPAPETFDEFYEGTGERAVSTTMVHVSILRKLLRDETWGKLIVPIIPDEARTFGMEALFRQIGIYSSVGQLYEPVDRGSLMYYHETTDGQILEEGITEAGSMSSFIAAGTAYANHGVNTVPFFTYYSMFGFQRIGDLIWAAADSRTRGFLMGATAGRTTLAGEGLQHQDGNSHVLALPVPNLRAYDPAFAFELASIVEQGMKQMYEDEEDVFYYVTIGNENVLHPAAPEHLSREELREGIGRGMYLFAPAEGDGLPAQLLGSGTIMVEVLKAAEMLKDYGVAASVWSVTSYKELYMDAGAADRQSRLNPGADPVRGYAWRMLEPTEGPIVATTDYIKALPGSIAGHLPRPPVMLGTDGFGRSEDRARLRDFFEVDARHIVLATLKALADEGSLETAAVTRAMADLGIDPAKPDPQHA